MERVLAVACPAPAAEAPAVEAPIPSVPALGATVRRLIPLWRHAVWVVSLFAVLAAWVQVRVDVQQLRTDLDRNGRATREARIVNDRLRLEVDSRRRAVAVEALAAQLQMTSQVPIVHLTATQIP